MAESLEILDLERMRALIKYGLLPRDAIHVAVAQRLGIGAFASADPDFEHIPEITLYKPQ